MADWKPPKPVPVTPVSLPAFWMGTSLFYAGGRPLTKEERTNTVTFKPPLPKRPTVIASLAGFHIETGVSGTTACGCLVEVTDPNENGFSITVSNPMDKAVYYVTVSWTLVA